MFSRPTTRRIRNEKSASQQNVRLLKKLLYIVAELDVCIGSSEAAQNSTDGWSKDGCDAAIFLVFPPQKAVDNQTNRGALQSSQMLTRLDAGMSYAFSNCCSNFRLIFHFWQTLRGPFSAISIPNIASKF